MIKRSFGKGFTLMEILIYLTIFILLFSVIVSFIFWLIRSSSKAVAWRQTTNDTGRIMNIMTREIREAESIYSPTSSANQLSLKTKKHLPEGEQAAFIDFFVCSDGICLKKENQEPVVLTSGNIEVSNLVFSFIGTPASSVRIDLALNYKNPENKKEYEAFVNLSSTVSLRAY